MLRLHDIAMCWRILRHAQRAGQSPFIALSQVLDRMELYNDDTRHGFEHTLGWLRQWACSRSFGLGTWRVP